MKRDDGCCVAACAGSTSSHTSELWVVWLLVLPAHEQAPGVFDFIKCATENSELPVVTPLASWF